MNTLLIFTVLFAGACMADVSHLVPAAPHHEVPILNQHQDVHPDGRFQYKYETGDGISAQAEADANGEVHGQYAYQDPTGQHVEVHWTAGVEGFNANNVAHGAAKHVGHP